MEDYGDCGHGASAAHHDHDHDGGVRFEIGDGVEREGVGPGGWEE